MGGVGHFAEIKGICRKLEHSTDLWRKREDEGKRGKDECQWAIDLK